MEKHKIARLVTNEKQYDKYGAKVYEKIDKLFNQFVNKVHKKQKFEFIVTPGGFLSFPFSDELSKDLPLLDFEVKFLEAIITEAEDFIEDFLSGLPDNVVDKIVEIGDFLTLGVDGYNSVNNQTIELVGVLDLKQKIMTLWTGKFYPTEGQKETLIKVNDLDSHFIELNDQKVAILGCHDLNVFSPRGQANVNADSFKGIVSAEFRNKIIEYQPDIIIQHPHTTDTSKIWSPAWKEIERELPSVKHYASGIKYYNPDGEPRGTLESVLEKTKKGDVVDFYFG